MNSEEMNNNSPDESHNKPDVLKGISNIFNILSNLVENTEASAQIKEEVKKINEEVKKINEVEIIKKVYAFSVKEFLNKQKPKLKSIPPIHYIPRSIEVTKNEDMISIKMEINDCFNKKINISHAHSLETSITDNLQGLEFYKNLEEYDKDNYKIENIKIQFPYLILILKKIETLKLADLEKGEQNE